ncbi:hypothetical protein ABI_40230 [Asticcacaulis biprosthecium C19]|uniref:UPF0386 protein ABI_40230 n=1 Tax=Asticcacaulis biprosthecium C19 TaxID=715226 RepID=F4QS86_9CAUL|nr:YjhX family toxin [Asticcacaulis biprosthecium]EGF89606.1 hypothetical protein ABI_40230 [Asticcacaulis biprosthecium C19]
MNISKAEQRVLHVLAQGGHIRHERNNDGRLVTATCFNRDGYVLNDCTMAVFKKLKKRHLIESKDGAPYRISYFGRISVRSQLDNR